MSEPRLLVLNAGSTSLKAGVFAPGSGIFGERALLTASASGIGNRGTLVIADDAGKVLREQEHAAASPEQALQAIAAELPRHGLGRVDAVGHRVVHGGPRLRRHTRLTPSVVETLRSSVHFAPLHLPAALRLIEAAAAEFPQAPQFACFDTAFHATMPAEATRLPIPERFARQGVQRYGFHGLSYESIVTRLRSRPEPLPQRIVCAHLGGGSSLCALLRGRSLDTTMGLSPSSGIPMGTRTGDLDPEVLLFLARTEKLDPDALEQMVNKESGLKGICGAADMEAIEAALHGDAQARNDAGLAFRIFTTAVAKQVAALTVSLGGLDMLVFAGGIGEHSAAVRAAVLEGLAPFGVRIASEANAQHAPCISAASSRVRVEIVAAEEDAMIATHVLSMLAER